MTDYTEEELSQPVKERFITMSVPDYEAMQKAESVAYRREASLRIIASLVVRPEWGFKADYEMAYQAWNTAVAMDEERIKREQGDG